MSDEEAPEPIRPLRSFIEGLGIPGGIILVLMAIGGIYGLFNHGGDLEAAVRYIRGAAGLGLFLIIIGGLEIAFGRLLWDGGPWQNRLSRFAGMVLVWLGLWAGLLYL